MAQECVTFGGGDAIEQIAGRLPECLCQRSRQIIEHSYDVVVLGSGGAGLRATMGMVTAGLRTACVPDRYSAGGSVRG